MSRDSVEPRDTWKAVRPYLLAAAGLIVATLVRMALDPILGDRQAFMTYMATLIGTAWLGGVGPALMVLILSLPMATFFFMEPRYNVLLLDGYNFIAVGAYVLLGCPIVALGGRFWRARQEARRNEELYGTQAQELAAERKRLNQELGSLTDQLRDVDRRREDFLGLLADELRRPLIPIASAASFHGIAATASEMESAMDVVKQETCQLGRLIDDLLDAFRHSQAGIQLVKRKVDLVDIATRAASSVRSLAAQSGRELNISLAKNPVLIDGDATRLERVTFNLLNSAIRSTNPGGQIWLTVQEREGVATLKVKDTGAGLTPEALARVFQAGNVLGASTSRERGGSRISMTAVKPIVELHGGMITAHSDGPGQGCEFVVRLPLVGTSLPVDNTARTHTSPNDIDQNGTPSLPAELPDTVVDPVRREQRDA